MNALRWIRSVLQAAFLVVVAASAGLVAIPGAGAQGLTSADKKLIDKLLGPGVLGSSASAEALADPASLLPLRPTTWTFRIVSGPNQGNTETDTLQPVPSDKATPWHYDAGHDTDYLLRQAADGSIVSPAEKDLGEGVLTRYDPPRPMLLKGAEAGVPQTLTTSVNVYDLGDTSTVTHSGSLTLTYTYLGRYQLKVPAGTYPAAVVKMDYNGSIGPASVEDTEYWFYAQGVGPVAMIEKEDVSAFLVYNKEDKYGKALAAKPQ
jgi:hypothetical protein